MGGMKLWYYHKAKKIKYFVFKLIIKTFRITGFLKLLPDKLFLKLYYPVMMNEDLDLVNPKTFNQKLQWLKLYDRKPEYSTMVDKYAAKEYVSKRIGSEYVIPTLSVWEKFEDINFDALPNQFVLKCTHDSGGVVICRDKSKLDLVEARKKINNSLKNNYFYNGREGPYKNVKPRIIAEAYMEDKGTAELRDYTNELNDYKLFCFNGEPRFTLVCTDRFSERGLKEDFFDLDWRHMPMKRHGHDNSPVGLPKPSNYDLMCKLARRLAKNIPFIRCDFYEIDGKVYLGEMTFFPASGFEGFEPREWDQKVGEWLTLPARNSDAT